ncbi:MAG: methylenetetrahydrofolate reductase C-terminal domain-containing protein [Dehalococcoidales bacterium]|nr:methylenetetrahydrofolate reductase C-terminal domain-containing protein [Dehalococcoidales bacterium]
MIIAERKPFNEIKELIKGRKKVLVLGCGTCVSVCMAGGEKEVGLLASELRMAGQLDGGPFTIGEATIQRQCDREYIEPIVARAREYDAVLSMGCGAGVQFVADVLETIPVFPALNTRFIGVTEAEGTWAERCRACGDCLVGEFGGICPVTRCTKGLTNGPCGGTRSEKCEAKDSRDCGWVLIYNRLKAQGRLANMRKFVQPRDYSRQDHPLRVVAEAYVKPEIEKVASK